MYTITKGCSHQLSFVVKMTIIALVSSSAQEFKNADDHKENINFVNTVNHLSIAGTIR